MQAILIFGVLLFLLCVGITATFCFFFSVLPAIGAGLSLLILGGGLFHYFKEHSSENKTLSLIAIGLGGFGLGASIGAIAGSFVPVLGTALGAVLGGMLGLVLPLASTFLVTCLCQHNASVSQSTCAPSCCDFSSNKGYSLAKSNYSTDRFYAFNPSFNDTLEKVDSYSPYKFR